MAFRDINEAGGVRGCDLVTDTRDSQSQGNVAVDVASQLVQVKKVPAIIGGIISSVSIPILTSVTPYNEKQPSYQAEVTAAMAGGPDGLYLISYPVDGATIARQWISQGGVAKFLLNDGMNSTDFIANVGAKYLDDAFGTSSGTNPTASTDYFMKNYKEFSGLDPANPAADRSYDAGAIVGLAIAQAGKPDSTAIKEAINKVLDPKGEVIHAGKDEFAKALKLIKEGKPIKYEGVIGPVTFDQYGDITGPFRLWRIQKGEITTVGEMTTTDVDAIKAKIGN
jgi:branched-chain amino acid transport system substrate-binding protein